MLIDRLIRFLLPRQDHFFAMLEELAGQIDAAAAVFAELETAAGRNRFEDVAARLKPIETAADEFCRKLYQEIDRTFVTPIDREDLARLTKVLDNVVDSMEHTAAFALLYRFEVLTEPMRHLVRVTVACSRELAGAAPGSASSPTRTRCGRRPSPSTRWRTRPTACTARPSPRCSTATCRRSNWFARRTCCRVWKTAWISARTRWTPSAPWW